MPINPSINMMFRPPEVQTAQNALAQAEQVKAMQMRNALAQQELDDAQAERDFAASPEGQKQKQLKGQRESKKAAIEDIKTNLPALTPDNWNQFGEYMQQQYGDAGVFGQPYNEQAHSKMLENFGIKKPNAAPTDYEKTKTDYLKWQMKGGRSQGGGGSISFDDNETDPQSEPYRGIVNDPINFISDPKERDKAIAKRLAETEKELTDIDESAYQLGESAALGRQFMSSLESQEKDLTGKYGASLTPSFLGKFDKEISTMDAITAKLTPAQRVAGSGTTSDKDMAFFEQATLGRGKNKETNKMLADAMTYVAKRAKDRAEFFRNYSSANAGDLSGAKKIWNEYINSESISPDGASFNSSAKDFNSWFGEKYGKSSAAVKPSYVGDIMSRLDNREQQLARWAQMNPNEPSAQAFWEKVRNKYGGR